MSLSSFQTIPELVEKNQIEAATDQFKASLTSNRSENYHATYDLIIEAFKSTLNQALWCHFLETIYQDQEVREKFSSLAILHNLLHEYTNLNLSPQIATRLTKLSLHYYPSEKETIFEILMNNVKLSPVLVDSIKDSHSKDMVDLYKLSVKKYHATLLHALIEHNKELVKIDLSPNDRMRLHLMLTLSSGEEREMFTQRMKHFMYGLGRIVYEDILFICSEVQARKKRYDFNPTVLANADEFKEYLSYFKFGNSPAKERFICLISHVHWAAGEIQVNKDGQATLIYFDPLGSKSYYTEKQMFLEFTNTFPQSTIYISSESLQKSTTGCSLFALDALRHFYTVEEYIKGDLVDYLKKSQTEQKKYDISSEVAVTVNECLLPRPFAITSHYLDTFQELKRSTEKVNKKGQTAIEAGERFFKKVNREGKEVTHNTKILYQLDKMAEYLAKYIAAQISSKQLDAASQNFSLKSFEKRMKSQTEQKKTPKSQLSSG